MHPPKSIPLFTPHNICFSAYLTRLNIFPHPAKSPLTSELFSTGNFLEKRYSTEKKIQQLPHAFIYSHFDTQIRTNPTSSPNFLRNGGRTGEKKSTHKEDASLDLGCYQTPSDVPKTGTQDAKATPSSVAK